MWLELLRELLYLFLQICKHIPWLEKRGNLRMRIDGPWEGPSVLWFHGASMGECGVLLQISRELVRIPILITTQKPEVRLWLQERVPTHVSVALAPLDHSAVVGSFLDQVRPRALVLCENELWPNWIMGCAVRSIPVALVSGVLSEKAKHRWNRFAGKELQNSLKYVKPLWVQNQITADRFREFGKKDFKLCGDWKWLSTPVHPSVMQLDTVAQWEGRPIDLALISIHREDWPSLFAGLVTYVEFGGCPVLIPRWPKEVPYFAKSLLSSGIRICFWPKMERGCVTIVEQFGQVRSVLEKSRLALVGGSFCSFGVHNYREPLFAGVPVLVGPNGGNQEQELQCLEDSGVVKRLGNLEELCLGRQGRDAWLSSWFPWEKRYQIPQAIAEQKILVDESFRDFQQWLHELRIFAP